MDGIRLNRRGAGKANGENRNQIQTVESQQFQILLPQQQDEEEFVGQHVLPLCLLQKQYLHPVLH
jgi:hypothetical protein